MNNTDKTNIAIFRLVQENFCSFEKIFFTINDSKKNDIKSKDITIRLIDIKNNVNNYQLILFNTTINELIKNIHNKNLILIEINFSTCAMDIYQLDYFPNFIKKLKLDFKFNCDILNKLPENLEYLEIHSNPREIKTELNNLPNKLKVLSMIEITYNLPLDNLPSSLEKLIYHSFYEYNHNLDNLPSNLNFLEIFLSPSKNLNCINLTPLNDVNVYNNLPDNLEVLKLQKYGGLEINKYPKKLKTFELYTPKKYQINNVPENVEYIYYELF